MANKAGIDRVKVDKYEITGAQITKYLQDQLGFPIEVEYRRWPGVTAAHSYVRMGIGIRGADISVQNNDPTDYVGRLLRDNSVDIELKPEAVEVLTRYAYPDGWWKNLTPEDREKMYKYGLSGDKLQEIFRFSKLNHVEEDDMWIMFVRVESIIMDMLKDPDTDHIDGVVKIRGVYGTDSDSFVWEVDVIRGSSILGNNVISLDRLFR